MSDKQTQLETTGPIGDNWFLSFAASLCVLGVAVVLTHKAQQQQQQQQQQHDVYNWKTHGIFWALAFLVDFFLPYSISVYAFSKFTLALVANLLPVYESVYAACTPDEDDDTYWLRYWTVGGISYVAIQVVARELWTDDLDELWYKFGVFFVFWLYYPATQGSLLIDEQFTQKYLAPRLRPLVAKMDSLIDTLLQIFTNVTHLSLVLFFFFCSCRKA